MPKSDLSIEYRAPNGSVWHVSGEGAEEEGVLLLPKPTKLYDAPTVTYWAQSAWKHVYQGFRIERREPVIGFQIWAGPYGTARDWRDIDSDFSLAWEFEREGQLVFITDDGERSLGLRKLTEPTCYEGNIEQGKDPFMYADATVVMNTAGENPLWVGETVEIPFTCPTTSGSTTFEIENDGNTDMWPRWTASCSKAGGRFVLPDWSFGSDAYGRAIEDQNRTWPTPVLLLNEHIDVNADPDEELLASSLGTNPWNRTEGNGLMYPIPAHTPKTQVPVSWSGVEPGDSIMLTYTRMYTRPWGVTR
ncbi:minor tail protein [Gordonia phage Octobien14]|uniref:Minor tail protein n=1 Tax=Gordonia phage Octobien14 TaxID=2483673 RepID=A0A3G3M9U2_9CAUD|nr:minor tail protein [Gordonia phage Octobien14]AYR03175.1 minor tail protein [Gordonia phage Octobien14]